VGFVRSFVAGETDVAIDAREIIAGPSGDQDFRIELHHMGRELFQKIAEWLNDLRAISLAIRFHPGRIVVAAELAEEFECLGGQAFYFPCHLKSPNRCGVALTEARLYSNRACSECCFAEFPPAACRLRIAGCVIASFGESAGGLPGASERRAILSVRRAPAINSIYFGGA